MANIRLTYTWAEGESLEVELWTEDNYPDSLAQARGEAVRTIRDAVTSLEGANESELPDT